MSGRILCCVNGSAHARRAVEVTVELAKGLEHGISFLLVNHLKPASGYSPIKALGDEKAKEILEISARYATTHGVRDVKRVLVEAYDVADAILAFARENDIGHIVVGTGNPPLIGRLLLGSVSGEVVAKATCSVTVAR